MRRRAGYAIARPCAEADTPQGPGYASAADGVLAAVRLPVRESLTFVSSAARLAGSILFFAFALGAAPHIGAMSRDADHPLIGKIWDVRAARYIALSDLERRLAGSHFVLLGEIHDNPEHHRVQRELVAALLRDGRRPAIAMEQFDREHQQALATARAERPRDTVHVKEAGRFDDKGWQWRFYEPIVALALDHGVPLVAANLSRADARRVVASGLESLGSDLQELRLDQPFEAARRERLARVIDDGHCGKLPPASLAGMVNAQRARDAVMAQALASHREDGAVLIAGNGHVRRDFGVPYHLERLAPGASVSSVAPIEARPDRLRPTDYAAAESPQFDYLWFTPAAARDDPCAQLNK